MTLIFYVDTLTEEKYFYKLFVLMKNDNYLEEYLELSTT